MYKSIRLLAAVAMSICTPVAFAQGQYPGRPATDKEIAAWDIDVRPDFKGLPKGAGTVTKGMEVWEGKCASCHGTFGESNQVFTPIVGGTTKEDVRTGRVAALTNNSQPQRTTMMKVATVSTLWDYINRAMPWTAPKSLSTEEVYAVTAYILNMAEVIPDDFTLSDQNIAQVQKLMPNRNGMTDKHPLWNIKTVPDVKSTACMSNCAVDAEPHSTLPPTARGAHGNLKEQNRSFGPVRGVDTGKVVAEAGVVATVAAVAAVPKNVTQSAAAPTSADGLNLVKQYACVACHGVTNKIVGPGFNEIAAKYKGDATAGTALAGKIKNGTSGTWGAIPMPAQSQVKDADLKTMVDWMLDGAK